jgi:hypothetical protein
LANISWVGIVEKDQPMRRHEWRIRMEILQNGLLGVIGINEKHVYLDASSFELENEFPCA